MIYIYFLLVKCNTWIWTDEIDRTVHVLSSLSDRFDKTVQGLGPCNNQYIIKMQGAHKKKKGGEEGLVSLGRHVREGRSEWKQNLKKKELKNLRTEGRTEWKEVGVKRSLKERRNGHRRVRNPDVFRGDWGRLEGKGREEKGRPYILTRTWKECFFLGFFGIQHGRPSEHVIAGS